MAYSTFTGIFFLSAFFLIFLIRENEAVKCYICSWSPSDNRSDTCTNTNFIPEYAMVHDCDGGCEVVSMRDGNGAVEMFYRNCLKSSTSQNAYDKIKTPIYEADTFTCDWKLCNEATSVFINQRVIVLAVIAVWCLLSCGP